MEEEDRPFSVLSRMPGHPGVPVHMLPMPVILLLLAEEPAHGYALYKKMTELGVYEEGTEASVVYPALRMLKEEGLVDTELVDEGAGPPRKVYHLTPAGRITLAAMAEHLQKMSRAIDYFQERYAETGPVLRDTRQKSGARTDAHGRKRE